MPTEAPTSLPLIAVDVTLPEGPARSGAWYPLKVTVRNPVDSGESAHLVAVTSHQSGIELNDDLVQRGIEIRPGERYRFTLPVRTSSSPTIRLDDIRVQIREELHDTYPLRSGHVTVLPSLRDEIEPILEPVCRYDGGTKVILRLRHRGATVFQRFGFGFEESKLLAGKAWGFRPEFRRGDEEQFELVVEGEELGLVLKCVVDGEVVEDRVRLPIPPVGRKESATFRFLEPKRLTRDDVSIWPEGLSDRKINDVDGAFPLRSGQTYRLRIDPTDEKADKIDLPDVPGVFHVRHAERTEDGKAWKFLIDVAGENRLFSRPERMFYTVTTTDGVPAGGEIHVKLLPTVSKRWMTAIALGFALTFQGAVAVARFIQNPDLGMIDALVEFDVMRDYQLMFLPCIPLFWVVLKLGDLVQYHLNY